VASFADLIPAEVAPIVRPDLQHFQPARVSIQMLYGIGKAFGGVSYRSVDATPKVALVVSVVALLVGWAVGYAVVRCLCRKRDGKSGNHTSSLRG
jgi:hypothetical protein